MNGRIATSSRARGPGIRFLVVAGVLAIAALGCEETKTLSVTGLEPSKGKYLGGDHVYVNGTGFKSQGFKVYFGGKPATNCSVESTTKIMCDSPAGPKDQTVDVEVVFDDAKSVKLSKAFTYIDPIGEGGAEVPTIPKRE